MMSGLEEGYAADSGLCFIDGEAGQTWVLGDTLEQWSQEPYVSAIQRLWKTPDLTVKDLGKARVVAYQQLKPHFSWLFQRPPLEGLKAIYSLLEMNPESDFKFQGALVLGAAQVYLAHAQATKKGGGASGPQESLSPLDDFISMSGSGSWTQNELDALKIYWLTVAEHGLNASTFTCRVIASTQSDMFSAVTGAIGALKGPLHGGAPAPVLEMLEQLALVPSVADWVKQAISKKERIMGFGHRVYRQRDPRAEILKQAVLSLETSTRLKFASQIESIIIAVLKEAKPDQVILTNVEFYTAILLDELGFEPDMFTSVFALGRILGWVAHYREQVEGGRLIRPRARYTGPRVAVLAGRPH